MGLPRIYRQAMPGLPPVMRMAIALTTIALITIALGGWSVRIFQSPTPVFDPHSP